MRHDLKMAKKYARKADNSIKGFFMYIVLCLAALVDATVAFFKDTTYGHYFGLSCIFAFVSGATAVLGQEECAGFCVLMTILMSAVGVVDVREGLEGK